MGGWAGCALYTSQTQDICIYYYDNFLTGGNKYLEEVSFSVSLRGHRSASQWG